MGGSWLLLNFEMLLSLLCSKGMSLRLYLKLHLEELVFVHLSIIHTQWTLLFEPRLYLASFCLRRSFFD